MSSDSVRHKVRELEYDPFMLFILSSRVMSYSKTGPRLQVQIKPSHIGGLDL